MPALEPTELTGTITWLGRVPHRDAARIEAEPLDRMILGFEGLVGEHHAGLTRASCSRVLSQYPRGTEIRNVRQLSVLCQGDLDAIARDLRLEALDPAWLGASVVVQGLPDFSFLPPSARLQADDGPTLVVDMQNLPCKFPEMTIEAARPGHGRGFRAAAEGRRGITAWVERPGTLRVGQALRLHVPGQRAWRGAVPKTVASVA